MSNNINLPDALKTKPMATVSTMNVDTNILDPVICNQEFCRFVLEKKGILDAGSTFTFSLGNAHVDMDALMFLPVRTGIHALIKRAVLRVGTKIISNVDDYAHYQTCKRQFKSIEEKNLKDMIKIGTHEGLEPGETDGTLQMKSAIYDAATKIVGKSLPEIRILNDFRKSPVFQIKLSDLFPMLKNIQLPLFVFNEPVSVELTFNTQADGAAQLGNVACAGVDPGGITYSTAVFLNTNSVKFLADYLTYDDDTMNQTAAQVMSAEGLQMPYEDLIETIKSVPVVAGLTGVNSTTVNTDVAVSNRRVRSLLVTTKKNLESNPLSGAYHSNAQANNDEINVKINDVSLYPNDVKKEAQKQYELSKVFGRDIECHNVEYSLDALTNKQDPANAVNNILIPNATLFEGHPQSHLLGTNNYIGIDLSSSPENRPGTGTLIGDKPIQLKRVFKRVTAENNKGHTMRVFAMVERMMVIKDGSILVSN